MLFSLEIKSRKADKNCPWFIWNLGWVWDWDEVTVGWRRVPQTPGKRSGFPGLRKSGTECGVAVGPLQAKRLLFCWLCIPGCCHHLLFGKGTAEKRALLRNDKPPSLAGGRGRLLSAHVRRMWPGTTVTTAANMHECDSVLLCWVASYHFHQEMGIWKMVDRSMRKQQSLVQEAAGSDGMHIRWVRSKQACVSCSVVSDSLRPHGLSMGLSRQGYWSGLPFASPGDLSHPGVEPGSPALQADSLPSELPGNGRHCFNSDSALSLLSDLG